MIKTLTHNGISMIGLGAWLVAATACAHPLVIAHRGASGYLPEHSLEAAALAHGMGADYIEVDLVCTKDRVPVVLHDTNLIATTDVASVFPQKRHSDGGFYVMDFTLAEIKQLKLHERHNAQGGAAFPERFPAHQTLSQIPTLKEMAALVAGLNRSRQMNTGLHMEIKSARHHQRTGIDIVAEVFNRLGALGDLPIMIQSFEAQTLKRLRTEFGFSGYLVQLTSGAPNDAALVKIKGYADAIGPQISRLYEINAKGMPQASAFYRRINRHKLAIHAYTARADSLPYGMADFQDLLALLFGQLRIAGVFTDFPDLARSYIEGH